VFGFLQEFHDPWAELKLVALAAGFQSFLLYAAGYEAAAGVAVPETLPAAAGAPGFSISMEGRAQPAVQPASADYRVFFHRMVSLLFHKHQARSTKY
jgi:hypothetical protein